MTVHADAIDAFVQTKRNEAIGQFDLFGGGDDGGAELGVTVTPPVPPGEWEKADLLGFEREMLGLYVSDHPLFGIEHVLAAASDSQVLALTDEGVSDGKVVTIGGILGGVARRVTKLGKPWATASLEDLSGVIEVLFFPATYELVGMHIAEDAVVVVRGRVDKRDDVPRIIATDLSLPNITEGPRGPVVVTLPAQKCTPPVVAGLREVLTTHPGTTEVRLQLTNGAKTTMLRLGDGLRVTPSTALMGDLKALLGAGSIVG
jgi:DNA polymerase-3 subunit alpha